MVEFNICEVPAGVYPIGDGSLSISRPPHTVKLASFAIGRTTVTNTQFATFMNADGYTDSRWWTEMSWHWQEGKGRREPDFWRDPQFNAPEQPVVGVSWYEADAFTRWLAQESGLPWRLPSEAEWEAAALGPDAEMPGPRQFNTAERGIGRPWPVTPGGNVSWCGAVDLCGNVWEWCSTRWGRNWQTLDYAYPYNGGDGREDLGGSHARLIRGGSWFDSLKDANPANRGRYLPGSRGSNVGFRLARSLG